MTVPRIKRRRPFKASLLPKPAASVSIMLGLVFLGACAAGGSDSSVVTRTSPPVAGESTTSTAPPSALPASPTNRDANSTTSTGPPVEQRASQACEANAERVHSLGAMGSNCDTARRVSTAYDAKLMGDGTFPGGQPLLVDDGWSCRVTGSSGDGGEVFGVVCSKGDESITFEWGV